jgi:hypothetical protein
MEEDKWRMDDCWKNIERGLSEDQGRMEEGRRED